MMAGRDQCVYRGFGDGTPDITQRPCLNPANRTALLSETNYDLNDGTIDVLNVSSAVERTPRLSYLLAYRFIDEKESNLLGFDLNYRMTEKHTLALRELFDLDRGETLDFTIALVRKFPRWFGALSFELDQAEDDFGV